MHENHLFFARSTKCIHVPIQENYYCYHSKVTNIRRAYDWLARISHIFSAINQSPNKCSECIYLDILFGTNAIYCQIAFCCCVEPIKLRSYRKYIENLFFYVLSSSLDDRCNACEKLHILVSFIPDSYMNGLGS